MNLYSSFFFSSRRRHTRYWRDWSSDVCSSDLDADLNLGRTQEAAQIYREQLKRWPNKAFLHGSLATVLKAMGKSEDAQRRSEERRVGKECRDQCSPDHKRVK